ncbi:MAG: DUF1553 domain-containing protein, partial [Planctomycetota bacterium]|nr:DUF1553 domain-containing protein [Planctomycetota bacterium]
VFLDVFDAPDNFNSTAIRNITTTATQSLLMINGNWTIARARAMSNRLGRESTAENQVAKAYRLAYGRDPTARELQDSLEFLDTDSKTKARRNQLTDFCHVILNSNEFLYVD